MFTRFFLLLLGLLLAGHLSAQAPAVQAAPQPVGPAAPKFEPSEALAKYVTTPDESFRWSVRRRWKSGESRGLEISLDSQTWRGMLWKHQLFIYYPAKAKSGAQGICLIDGGAWKDEYREAVATDSPPQLPGNVKMLSQAAEMLGAPIICIRQVPHQPLFDNLYEDAIIAHTFAQYIKTGEADWPLLLPMVKTVVRALDAAQAAAKAEWQTEIPTFIVTGASKRGWTTWLTAGIEPRVVGIAPIVIDTLNMVPQMAQQLRYYGRFSDQIKDYTDKGLQALMLTSNGRNLLRMVDPFEYRTKINVPKLIILGTNDPYWTVDALNLYFDDLPGEKYVLYAPNQGHDIKDLTRLVGGIGALYSHTAGTVKLPDWNWRYDADDTPRKLTVGATTSPLQEVTLWSADSETRDFRRATFVPRRVKVREQSLALELERPATGYRAVFAEGQFDRQPMPLILTTTIKILAAEK